MDYEYWTKTINKEDRKINNANRRFRYHFRCKRGYGYILLLLCRRTDSGPVGKQLSRIAPWTL